MTMVVFKNKTVCLVLLVLEYVFNIDLDKRRERKQEAGNNIPGLQKLTVL